MKLFYKIAKIIFFILIHIVLVFEIIWMIKYSLSEKILDDEMMFIMGMRMIIYGIPTLTLIILWNTITKEK